jgi:hypothetical protein
MEVNRNGHSATVLPNGKILVSGGRDNNTGDYLASAEVYDPVQDSWSSVGAMSAVRQFHAATLLANGTVLVTGGSSNWGNSIHSSTPITFAELYNPAIDSWSVVGAMATARTGHTANLLPNGNVLVAGGSDSVSALASSEIYHYTYTISTTASSGGNITSSLTVIRGTDSIPIVVAPAPGYHIASVLIDGVNQTFSDPAAFSITFSSVTADHTMSAAFAPNNVSLDVTLAGSGGGGGTVSDHGPSGYYCDKNPCPSAPYATGSTVTLYATPDTNSIFVGWNPECGNTGTCVLTMDTPKSVTASFDRLQWAKNENKTPPFYGLLINAYKDASNGDTIKAQSYIFGEELKFDNSINVIFDGGYDASYQTITPGYATVQGTMKISKGKVSVRRVKVK